MNRISALTGLTLAALSAQATPTSTLRLQYTEPAANWNAALPVGNGRLGAMVFGGITQERLQLNEDTLWSGGTKNWNNPDARNWLPKVREAVLDGRYVEADELCRKMQGPFNQSYLPLGDVLLEFEHDGSPVEYHRELDLNRAVALTRYRAGDVVYTRGVFVSHADQVIVVALQASKPGALTFSIRMQSALRHTTAASGPAGIVLHGRAPAHVEPNYIRDAAQPIVYDDTGVGEGMRFVTFLRALNPSPPQIQFPSN